MTLREIRRRSLLQSAVVAGEATLLPTGSLSAAPDRRIISRPETEEYEQTFEFDAYIDRWACTYPPELAGTDNPTLRLEPGSVYRIIFTVSPEGSEHDVTLDSVETASSQDEFLMQTDSVHDAGETQELVFEATEELFSYYSTVNPSRQRGFIDVAGVQNDRVRFRHLTLQSDRWVGTAPAAIDSVENPTLELDAGSEYRVVLTSDVDEDHHFVIEDASGDAVPVQTMTDNGQVTEVAFEATTEMAAYASETGQAQARGEIEVDSSDLRAQRLAHLEAACDIVLESDEDGWRGLAPDSLQHELNPTLELDAGEEYTIGWLNGDGGAHSLVVEEANDVTVAETPVGDREAEYQTLSFEATETIDAYRCPSHSAEMAGSISVTGSESSDSLAETDDRNGEESDEAADETPGFGIVASLAGISAGVATVAARWHNGGE
ncbi:hypothetical protein OB905_08735 [Halobacteria archaeon AArc-dxtr1]|nr:hypothetical protein [Halobacteria archaeon AArc-dxtr1]